MDDLEGFLSMQMDQLPEFRPAQSTYRNRAGQTIHPDINGNIHLISGTCGVTLDCVSSFAEAEQAANGFLHSWSFYQIWQIRVADASRILVGQKDLGQIKLHNPLGQAALFKQWKNMKGHA